MSFPSSTFRRDLAITKCQGGFPNEITAISYDPIPAVSGQNMTVTLSGTNTVTVLEGATVNVTGLYQGTHAFEHIMDFCKVWVEVNGAKCPVAPGSFKYITPLHLETHPDDPKNTTIEYDFIFKNPKIDLSCIEGKKFSVYYP
ncbi:5474_t:CDS:2 [Racocetra fulgida]|uniref:Phosphatidylglycerol/phosphatidylinositol transfer protein n=1 Tax=Racocetra fulgida TaxID=60492 RepID=A0A9N8ZN41_9GLOM|nr:5474_t:CDS:2 [Racocetra fulgida]